jgi:DNA polymerase (family 10)
MTERLLRAIEHPHVDIIGHLTGRLILRRQGHDMDVAAIVRSAAAHRVALEINSQPERLDLNDVHARLARDHGVRVVISSDAHSRTAFGSLRWGVSVARRAWLGPEQVLNTLPLDRFRQSIRRDA